MTLNANQKLLRRFYEAMVLLGVIDPTRGRQNPATRGDFGLLDDDDLWNIFLDSLCFVCDSEPGGDTVTAIAGERVDDDPIFWLGSNSKAVQKAKKHVCKILTTLKKIELAGEETSNVARSELLALCVDFSSPRIKTYRRWMLKYHQYLSKDAKDPNGNMRNPGSEQLSDEFYRSEALT
jgi:hypothetical protein